MTLDEERDFVRTMLFDFRLSLYSLRSEHLENYEIEMIAERYNMSQVDLINILEKVYNKTISGIKARKQENGNN